MTTAHLCIAIAIWIPYASTLIAKVGGRGGVALFGLEANRAPRDFLATLGGYRKRAAAAQLNGFEVTPAFAAAVLTAQQIGVAEQATIDALAIAFVLSRVLYTVCYLADWASLRSVVWFAGMGTVVALFAVSA
jgi:uncharacterized MAPEG superfamily protein